MDDETARAYDAQVEKLRFSIHDDDLDLSFWPDIGACYVKAVVEQERIWIVARPTEVGEYRFFALNPAAAFDLANAMLAEGERAGWYSGVSESGHHTPRTAQ